MMKEKNNFARAIEWLQENGIIKNQKDMAKRMGTTPTTLSRNKHGSVRRPDQDTLHKFNNAFGNIINIAYLRYESDVMLVSDLQDSRNINTPVNSTPKLSSFSQSQDNSSTANSSSNAKDDTIAALKREIAAKNEIILALKSRLEDKDCIVDTKDEIIRLLRQQIENYKNQDIIQKGGYGGYRIDGVAEHDPLQPLT